MSSGLGPNSLVDKLQQTVQQYGGQTAIASADQCLDFRQFDDLSTRLAASLVAKGIQKGDRIGLYSINSAEFALAYFAIIKAGAIVVPVNLLLGREEILYILSDAGICSLIYHPLFSDNVNALRAELPHVQSFFVFGDGASQDQSQPPSISIDQCLAQATTLAPIEYDANTDIASIIYTSGTTGKPKGAMLTHANLLSNTRSAFASLKLTPGRDILFVVLPMFHSFAHTVGMLLPCLHGCTFVPYPKFEVAAVADAIAQSKATVFMGVPTMYAALLTLEQGQEQKLSSLRYCLSGGAAMPLSIMQKFEARFGKLIYEGDGPTECSPVTSVNPIDGVRKPGSIGLPIADVEMTICDQQGKPMPDNETGEIVVRGPNVMKGYWRQDEATAQAFYADWYRTGDLGYRDSQGYFYIVDRIKDMIIVNGMNVYPKMVEDVLYQCAGVKEAAVVGLADEVHGEIPIAYVALEQDSDLTEDDLVNFCQQKLANFQAPRTIYFMDSLPKTPTGKILKRELRKVDI